MTLLIPLKDFDMISETQETSVKVRLSEQEIMRISQKLYRNDAYSRLYSSKYAIWSLRFAIYEQYAEIGF